MQLYCIFKYNLNYAVSFELCCFLGQVVKPPDPGYSCIGINSDSGYSSSSSATTNHSSLFEMVPHSIRRGITVREVFGSTVWKSLSGAPSPVAFAVKKISEPRS